MVLVLEIWQIPGFENEKWRFSLTGTCLDSRTNHDRRRRSYESVVWITEGTSLVRCAAESISFQDLIRRLPHSTFLDLTKLTDASDDAWENGITGCVKEVWTS